MAYIAHTGQLDRSNKPYIYHPIAVSQRVCSNEDVKMVALLHDVVEDTAITLDLLRAYGFKRDIVDAVDAISRRKNETYKNYIRRMCNNNERNEYATLLAVEVKLADLEHNTEPERWISSEDPTVSVFGTPADIKFDRYIWAQNYIENFLKGSKEG